MDFFERQDRARTHTKLLIAYFTAGVATLIVAIYLVIVVLFSSFAGENSRAPGFRPKAQQQMWQPSLFLGVAAGTLAVVAMGSLFKLAELSQGGKSVATMLGGRLVNPSSADPLERKLLNVVEEMALASGVPMPGVYILPRENGINAFAAGHSTGDAVIGVTNGCVRLLTRDELQGVIAHEFSHILNGDMRLNMRLIGLIFGIISLAVIGRVLLYARGDGRDRNALPILGLALIVIGWAGVFFGRLIQAAVSRQREFLADASAVQFTRNPQGLAGALKKIGSLAQGSRVENPHAEEVSHMFFGAGQQSALAGLFATHPPLGVRIRALDPGFDGTFPTLTTTAVAYETAAQTSKAVPGTMSALAPRPIHPKDVVATSGEPRPPNIRFAEGFQRELPAPLQVAAREPLGAVASTFGLLLSGNEATRREQLQKLSTTFSPAAVMETIKLLPHVQSAAARAKLPILDLCLGSLALLSPAQYQQFRASVQMLVETDGQIDLFEYVLQKVLLRHLQSHFAPVSAPAVRFYERTPLAPDIGVLLSTLAHAGHRNADAGLNAFKQGARVLGSVGRTQLDLLPANQCDLTRFDTALTRLAQAAPQIKKGVLNAAAETVAADGLINEVEAELLRAIADTLDCPVPPFANPIP
jgi:Zn-dependent protease with chaperone function